MYIYIISNPEWVKFLLYVSNCFNKEKIVNINESGFKVRGLYFICTLVRLHTTCVKKSGQIQPHSKQSKFLSG